eukprot:6480155-Amphidinium_carterae.1
MATRQATCSHNHPSLHRAIESEQDSQHAPGHCQEWLPFLLLRIWVSLSTSARCLWGTVHAHLQLREVRVVDPYEAAREGRSPQERQVVDAVGVVQPPLKCNTYSLCLLFHLGLGFLVFSLCEEQLAESCALQHGAKPHQFELSCCHSPLWVALSRESCLESISCFVLRLQTSSKRRKRSSNSEADLSVEVVMRGADSRCGLICATSQRIQQDQE